jgi:hypothetical protein
LESVNGLGKAFDWRVQYSCTNLATILASQPTINNWSNSRRNYLEDVDTNRTSPKSKLRNHELWML